MSTKELLRILKTRLQNINFKLVMPMQGQTLNGRFLYSWAFQHQAGFFSPMPFTRFYQVDVQSTADTAFGVPALGLVSWVYLHITAFFLSFFFFFFASLLPETNKNENG